MRSDWIILNRWFAASEFLPVMNTIIPRPKSAFFQVYHVHSNRYYIASMTTHRPAEVVVLERNFSYLVESIDAASVLPEALSKGLITDRQKSKCSGESDSYEKANEFLGYLYRTINSNHKKLHTFLQVLGQESIAERLRGL